MKKLNELQSYLTRLRGLMLTLIILCSIGVGNAWGETVTYTITRTNTVRTDGTAPAGSYASYSQTNQTAGQANNGEKMTLTLTGFDGCTITGLSCDVGCYTVLNYYKRGKGLISIDINGDNKGSLTLNRPGTSSSRKVNVTSTTVAEDGTIVITISATENSLYCNSYTITYTPPCTPLGTINRSVNLTQLATPDPTKLQASWEMNSTTGLADNGLIVKVYRKSDDALVHTSSALAKNTTDYTITGLSPCTSYYATLTTVRANSTYCEGVEDGISDPFSTTGYTYTVNKTNVSLKADQTEAANSCEYFMAKYVADDGYDLPATITVTNAGEEGTGWLWDDSDGSLIIDNAYVTGNVTVKITGTQSNYTVSWSVNGADWTGEEHGNPSTNAEGGTKPTVIPTAPDGDAVCGGSKVFVGWTNAAINRPTDERPAILFTSQSEAPEITENTTFYAVFATASGGGVSFDHYEKVTSAPDDWTAYKYVIATADDGVVLTGQYESSNWGAYATMSTTKERTSAEITMTEVSTGIYKLYQNTKYLALNSNGNNLYFTDTYTGSNGTNNQCDWKIYNFNSAYIVESPLQYKIGDNANQYRAIQYNATSGQERFACYKHNTQTVAYLYKRVESGSVSYSNYSTSCNSVATPKFTPAAGSYDVSQSVSISCSTPGATIYYTTDGTNPTSSSNVYNGAIIVNSTTTIKAFATKAGLDDSNVATATYTFQCATPTFSVAGGSYEDVQSIYLATTTVGATIYYTTNGTEPTASSTLYTGSPIVLDAAGTTTIKAIAVKDGLGDSEIASATYTLTKPTGSNIVTFVTGEGNPTVPTKWSYYDEDNKEWYVDFPNGPTPACADDGWMFAGWATSSQTETTVAPRLHMPGDSKQITAAITFYAVYRKETTGESTATYDASSMTSGYTVIAKDYWWLQNASGVEFYINNYGLNNGLYQIYYDSYYKYEGWAVIDAHNRIKKIEFKNESGYAIDHIGNDDGTATLTTNTSTSQTVTCEGNVTQVYLYPQDPENNDYEVKLSSFTVTYYNSKFNSNPVCDPIRPEEPERLTSSNGEKVYSKELTIVCSGVEGSTLNANITGTNASMFGCELASNTITDGELTTTYRVWYQPSEANATHTATLTFQDGKSPTPNSKAITLYGRSVPTQFAIVATDGSSNSFVLDGMLPTATRPTALPVTINGSNQVEHCPTRAIYTLEDLSTPDKYVHLVGPSGQLWGSTASSNGTTLATRAAESDQTGWLLETEDFNTYHVTNQAMGTRGVMLHEGVFGHYATSNYGASGYYGNLRILPIASTCVCLEAPMPTIVAKSNKAILTWAPVADAVSYTVTCSGGAVGTITGDETLTCEITGLSSNTEYTFTHCCPIKIK